MHHFSINVAGRIKNFSLPKNQPLVPLYEAIVNSIHSIEERREKDSSFVEGRVTVMANRDEVFETLPSYYAPIHGFTIIDNGIGFNENNIRSFMESDSDYKKEKGGKGVGRFSWLKAFDSVHIESSYAESPEFSIWNKRSFDFSADKSSINDILDAVEPSEAKFETMVSLHQYKDEYKMYVPKQLETIALKVLQHCLVYFISPICPEIVIRDDEDSINLNQLFRLKFACEQTNEDIAIGELTFNLLHMQISDIAMDGNRLYLCANNRLVDDVDIEKIVIDLDKQLYEKYGIFYVGVLTGEYFDLNVDMNRLSFSIPKTGDSLIDVSLDRIVREACFRIEKQLMKYLQPIRDEKNKRIEEYVRNSAPQFRHLLKYMKEDIAQIKPNLTNDKLDDELHRIKRKFDKRVKEDNQRLLDDFNQEAMTEDEYVQRFNSQVERISDANKSVLADYVAHRRIILDLLAKYIQTDDQGKYSKENYVHQLIYPMRNTAEDLDYESHNLWLIDERLAYSRYIASDVPLNNQKGEDRPDILVLSGPVAVVEGENDGRAFPSVTIFELKRPMRDDYSSGDNPIDQLYKYVERLQTGKIKDRDGRYIKVDDKTIFYLYAICDITPTIEKVVTRHSFIRTPDGIGYYKFNEVMHCYVEVLSYDKILNDSRKRNRILFDKLGV